MTIALATLASLTLLRPAPTPTPRPVPRAVLPAGDLYAARAKRRMAAYLRMRLLELRKEGLHKAVQVVEGRLPIEELLRSP
jgi:hypothetical protein